MLREKNYLEYFLLILFFFIITLYLNPDFSFSINSLKHWSTYNKDDIVFVYGTLIYSEGIEQQHLDHPSLFTFIFSSLFYKIFYFFGFLDHYTLSGFITSKEEKNFFLSKLFFTSKVTIFFFSILTSLIFYKILNLLNSNKFNSFLLTILFIFSTGFLSGSNRLESGLISIFLIFVSIFFFIKFINYKKKKNIIYFILAFIFLFSSMMQKKIVYFCIPFLILSLIPILKKNNLIYIKYQFIDKYFSYKFLFLITYSVVIIFISYKTLINNKFFLSRELDFIFLTINYTALNIIFFFFIKYYQNNFFQNLITYNVLIGATYFIYKYFLIYFFSASISIWSVSFTNFVGQLNMFAINEIKGELNFNSLFLYLSFYIKQIKFIILKYFLNFSFQSLLIWSNILLFLYNYKKINKKKRITIIILLIGFLLTQSVFLFRYEQDTYFLNSEIFLIIPLAYIFEYLKSKKIFLVFLISIILSSNINFLQNLKYQNSQSYCTDIQSNEKFINYYEYWTKNIPIEILLNFCKDRI